MKKEVERLEKSNLRFTEACTKRIDEYKYLVYQLLGYRIIFMESANQIKLQNMYSEAPDDFLLFKVSIVHIIA